VQVADGEGRASRLVIWSHPGNDVTGMLARSQKVAGICEKVPFLPNITLIFSIILALSRVNDSHVQGQN